MKYFLALVLLFVGALSATAHASDVDVTWSGTGTFRVTGNALVDACSSGESSTAKAMCYAYLHGAIDGQYYTAPDKQTLCVPEGVTNDQLVKVVMKFANDNPQLLNRTAFFIVERGITKAWGETCK